MPPAPNMLKYRDDPLLFVTDVIGAEPDGWQGEALRRIGEADSVGIKAGRGVGKDALLSWVVIWWLLTRFPAKVLCTAPKADQLEDVLWSEIAKWLRHMKPELAGLFEIKSDKLELREAPKESFAIARTARKENPEAFQGIHCFGTGHTILTNRGWLGSSKICAGDWVLSSNLITDDLAWMPVTSVHRYPFLGTLNVFDGKSVNFAVTDGHRMPVAPNMGKSASELVPFADLGENFWLLRAHGSWRGDPVEVPPCFAKFGFDAEQFARFIGFFIGDGGIRPHVTGVFYEIMLYQTKPKGMAWIEGLLDGTTLQWTYAKDYFAFSNRDIAAWLIENVGRLQVNRLVPECLMEAEPAILEALCEGLWEAEGSTKANGKRGQFYNVNAALMDQIQEIMLKLGRSGTIGVNRTAGQIVINGRLCNSVESYVMAWPIKLSTPYAIKKRDVKQEQYNGEVWCISTPWQTFYTRRNGRVFLSGNSDHLLCLADEASGIDDVIFETMEGSLSTRNSKQIMVGNPTRLRGWFYDAFHKMSDFWSTMTVSCLDARYADPKFIEKAKRKFGEDSNWYRVMVLGQFPSGEEDSVIPMSLVVDSIGRDVMPLADKASVWGVDVARFGDDESALAKRRGNVLIEPVQTWRDKDTMQTADIVARQYHAAREKPAFIAVDVIGLGAGVCDRLRMLGLPARGVNVAESPAVEGKYMRLRDELWFRAREWFEARDCALPERTRENDDVLDDFVGELTGPGFTVTTGGLVKVEAKSDMKKRGIPSPNMADAFCLTFAMGDVGRAAYAKKLEYDYRWVV